MKITIGADPEFFLINEMGVPQPAVTDKGPLIPGTKAEPHKVEHGAIQVDGCAIEFNVDPTDNVDQFLLSIDKVMKNLKGRLNAYVFHIEPTVQFDKHQFDKLPDEAKMLGCDPDFNAYTRTLNPVPRIPYGFRTAAGHVHVGWTKDENIFDPDHMIKGFDMARQLDLALYVPSLLWDTQNEKRQKYYGKAGAMRPKPYGMEYRVLSNMWLQTPNTARFVFNMTMWAAKELMEGRPLFDPRDDSAEFKAPVNTLEYIKELEGKGAPTFPISCNC